MQEYHQLKAKIEALSQQMKLHEVKESHLALEVDESAVVAEVVSGIPETHVHGIVN